MTLTSQCQGHSDFKGLHLAKEQLGHTLLLDTTRKPYMGSSMTLSQLTLWDLKRSKSMSLRFRSIIYSKGAELGNMSLLNINGKVYMSSLLVGVHLILENLKRQCQFTQMSKALSRK